MGVSETISFIIAVPEHKPEPLLVLPIAAASTASAVLIGVGLLVYLKKRRSTVVPEKSADQKERTYQSQILENNISLRVGKTL
jgi:hypothetical protein